MSQLDPIVATVLAAFVASLAATAFYAKYRLRQIDRRIEQIEAAERGETPEPSAH